MKSIFFSILCVFMASAYADSHNGMNAGCVSCTTQSPSNCAYNAPYGINLACPWDVFVTASFLYWEPKEENLELGAVFVEEDVSGTVITNEDITIFGMDFEYKPGFKVGAGFNFSCDNWQIFAEYTYHHSTTDASIGSIPEDGQLLVFWKSSLVNDADLNQFEPDRASSKWELDFDAFDVEVAREYYVGRCFVFRTFGGLRGAWIQQKYKVKYEELFTSGNFIGEPGEVLEATHTSKCWGVGPRIGCDMQWLFCGNFRAIADVSASTLFTKYTTLEIDTSFQDFASDDLALEDDVNSKTHRNTDFCFVRPQLEMFLGLGWGDCFFCNNWYFDIEIGYTFNVLWNQNMFVSMTTNNNNNNGEIFNKGGDLSFHGLTLTARVDF
jgi:hypothetical protein